MKNWECSLKKPNYYILFHYAQRGLISCSGPSLSLDISHTLPTHPTNPAPHTISNRLLSSQLYFMRIKHCPVALRTAEAGRSANRLGSGRFSHLRSWANVNMQQNKAGMEKRALRFTTPAICRGWGCVGDAGRVVEHGVFLLRPQSREGNTRNIWDSASEKCSPWSQDPTGTLSRETQNRKRFFS